MNQFEIGWKMEMNFKIHLDVSDCLRWHSNELRFRAGNIGLKQLEHFRPQSVQQFLLVSFDAEDEDGIDRCQRQADGDEAVAGCNGLLITIRRVKERESAMPAIPQQQPPRIGRNGGFIHSEQRFYFDGWLGVHQLLEFDRLDGVQHIQQLYAPSSDWKSA